MNERVTPRKELYPIIADIINTRFRQAREWVSRDEIVYELLKRRESASTIEHNWKRNFDKIEAGKRHQEWETTLEGYAGNWVDWFSARFNDESYRTIFVRTKDDHDHWMYRPK